jgi:uncharacterized protein YneF (UPF0154 family)
MKEIMIFFPGIMVMLLGIAIGMYISSQIKCHIRKNIFNKNIEEYEKKKTK